MPAPPRPSSKAPPPRRLTADEVAAMFRVSEQAIGRWVWRRRLNCTDTPDGRRFDEAEVRALLAARTTVRQP